MADLNLGTEIPVYLGFWTNWSRGRVAGATLTLKNQEAALLTAFLAIFVAFVGTSSWRIISYSLHQFVSSQKTQDGLYHQTQAILRNSGNGTTNFTRLLRVLWAWRHHKSSRPFYRIGPLVAATVITTAVFAAASIFSAKISSAMGNEVLISSKHCGYAIYNDSVDASFIETDFLPYISKIVNSYANYAETCYADNVESDAQGCGLLMKRRLTSTIDRNAKCPFGRGICRHEDGNIKLDSGPLNINTDLGYNVPKNLQYTVRYITQCAPLATAGFQQTFNYSNNVTYMRYLYGSTNTSSHSQPLNFTQQFQIPSVSQVKFEDFTAGMADYRLGVSSAYTYNGSFYTEPSVFIPTDELAGVLNDSDLVLIFLAANDVTYTTEINDDWYSAHRFVEFVYEKELSGGTHAYLADEPASTLGCTLHYEICYPDSSTKKGCPISGGIIDVQDPSNLPSESEDYSFISWVSREYQDLRSVIATLSIASLTARHSLATGGQGPLPDDQWQLEVENWHNITLSSFQNSINAAVGPNDPTFLKYFWGPPDSDTASYLCKNQKIRSASHSNFSVLGLVIVLAIGGLIIIISYTLESLLEVIDDRVRHVAKYSRIEWSANDVLQIQRIAHEELGIGTWKNCAGANAVPVTEGDQLLGELDIQDPKHPSLKAPSTTTNVARIDSSVTDLDSPQSASTDNDHKQLLSKHEIKA
ncbi:MAG: hypothetical protein Q9227_007078 [Pyrenula ochraceoflavens]